MPKLIETQDWGNQYLLYKYIPKPNPNDPEAVAKYNAAKYKVQVQMAAEKLAAAEQLLNSGAQLIGNLKRNENGIDDSEMGALSELIGSEASASYLDTRAEKGGSKSETEVSIAFFCVNCGISIDFQVKGALYFSLAHGISGGYAQMSGNLLAVLQLGIEAEYEYKSILGSKRLTTLGLPEISVPNEFAIGPILTLDAEAYFEATAEGTLLGGAQMSISNAYAYWDFTDKTKNQQYGWVPTFSESFKAKSEISATIGVDFPIGLGLGIDIMNGKFNKEVALLNKPAFQFRASIEVAWGFNATQNPGTGVTTFQATPIGDIWNDGECPGIKWGESSSYFVLRFVLSH